MNKKKFISKSNKETKSIAQQIGKQLKGGEFIALYGSLGSGKTTFVQGLAKGLNLKKRIISPTFILLRSYTINSKIFYHVDLYRLEDIESIRNIGLEEISKNSDNIIAVEWAEKLGEILPKKRIDIHLKHINENQRSIEIIENE